MGMQKELAAKRSRRPNRNRGIAAKAEWLSVDAERLRLTIALVAKHGGAVRFGYTRDGGAYAVGVYGLGEPYTEYVRPGEDVESFLVDLGYAFTEPGEETQVPLPKT